MDSDDNVWLPDFYYIGGRTYNTTKPISKSLDDTLLQSERWENEYAAQPMRYNIPVTPGVYTVRMAFSENYPQSQQTGARVFHVVVEGILAFKDLDIFKEAGGRGYRRVDKNFQVHAVGGYIGIEFVPKKGNPCIGTIEILSESTKGPHPDIRAVLPVVGDDPKPNWVDSYSVDDRCYCDGVTTYDHAIGEVITETSLGWMTVKEACEMLGPGPGSRGRPTYNDVQCGNGPFNEEGDEHRCPGRVDMGKEGCGHIGPKWNFGTSDDDNDGKQVSSALKLPPTSPKSSSKQDRFVLNVGGKDDDGSLVKNRPAETWKFNAGGDYRVRGNAPIPQYYFRSHRSAIGSLTYSIDGFRRNQIYKVRLGFCEVWGENCKAGEGARVMTIRINDRMYKNNLDLMKDAGCGKALVLQYVLRSDKTGTFNIVIGARQEGVKDKNAMVSFIEIVRA